MTNTRTVNVNIKFTDGTEQKFQFEDRKDSTSLGSRVKDLMNGNVVALKLPDKVVMFPMTQIKSIEFSPPLEIEVAGVLNNAKQLA